MSKASPDQSKRVIHRNRRTKAQIALDAERAAAEVVAALQNGVDPAKVLSKLRTRPEREAATAALAAWSQSQQSSPQRTQKRPYHRVAPTPKEQIAAANQRADQAEANARAAEARVLEAEHQAAAAHERANAAEARAVDAENQAAAAEARADAAEAAVVKAQAQAQVASATKSSRFDISLVDPRQLDSQSRRLVDEAIQYRSEAYKFHAQATQALSEARVKRADADQALRDAEALRRRLQLQTPEGQANAEVAAARHEAYVIRQDSAQLKSSAESDAAKIRQDAESEAARVRSEAAQYRLALWQKAKANGALGPDAKPPPAQSPSWRPNTTVHGQNVHGYSLTCRSAAAGGVFDLSEVAVLLHALHMHWRQHRRPQAGTLWIEFLTPTGRQKTALKLLLPDGHIYLDDFGTTSDVVVKRSLESILQRFTTHQPSAYPERIGGNIHQGGPMRYAWLRVRSGCFIISYAADYGAGAQGSHCSSTADVGCTLAFVVTLLSQFAAARGDLPAPLVRTKDPHWRQAAEQLDRDFACLATPELYAWNDWCLKTKPGPYRIA